MIRRSALLGLLLWLSPPLAACESIDDLAWMLGDWQASSERWLTEERWQQISTDSAEGVGRVYTQADGSLKSEESMRLVRMADEIYFIAKVAHNPLPVAFALGECAPDKAVFENEQHDFPQRITYRLMANDHLQVIVTDMQDKGFSIDFRARTPLISDGAASDTITRPVGPERH